MRFAKVVWRSTPPTKGKVTAGTGRPPATLSSMLAATIMPYKAGVDDMPAAIEYFMLENTLDRSWLWLVLLWTVLAMSKSLVVMSL